MDARTTHGRRLEAILDRLTEDDPWNQVELDRWLGLSHAYPRAFIDAIGQNSVGSRNLEDAYVLQVFDVMVRRGEIAMLAIDLYHGPFPDRMVRENNEILAGLPEPFYARFEGGKKTTGDDGVFGWSEPAPFRWSPDNKGPGIWVTLPPDEIPLEVGTTAASRTLEHMKYEVPRGRGGLARWPYNHTTLSVFREVPEDLREEWMELHRTRGGVAQPPR